MGKLSFVVYKCELKQLRNGMEKIQYWKMSETISTMAGTPMGLLCVDHPPRMALTVTGFKR